LFWVRRHLGFTVAEWRALPWWTTRLYLEGLEAEFAPPETVVDDDGEPVVMVAPESVGIRWS
jgi:hypothetical protein